MESLTNTVNVNSQSSEEIGKLVAENAASIAKLKDAMMGIQETLDANKKWALYTSTHTTFVNQEVKTLKQSSSYHNTRLNNLKQFTSALGFDVWKAIATISSFKTQVSPSGGSVQYLEGFFNQDDYNY